jgi:hypothetical protein
MKAFATSLLALLALAFGAFWWWRAPPAPGDLSPVRLAVAGVALRVDPRLARASADLANPAPQELDLVLALPELSPAGAKASSLPLEKLVFLTLRQQDEKIEPRDKPARLYARFFSPGVEVHPAGLILRRFETGSPYDGEQLYMTPPEGRAFWARCAAATQALPATCISEARIAGLDVRLRFKPEALGDWEALTAGVTRLVEAMAR